MFAILTANIRAHFQERAAIKAQGNYEAQKQYYAELADVSHIEDTDKQFDAELQVYKGMDGVSVDADLTQKYKAQNNEILRAKSNIKTSSNIIKSQLKNLKELESNTSEPSLFSLYQKIHEAKKKYDRTMPFSQEAKAAKEAWVQAIQAKNNAILTSKGNNKKIDECTAKIEEEQQKINENMKKIDVAVGNRDNLISQVRPQFQVIKKIRAQYIFLKHVADFNDTKKYEALPDGNPQKQAFLIAKEFIDAYEKKGNYLTISLNAPLREYTEADLTTEYTATQTENGLEINLPNELNSIVLASKKLEVLDNSQLDTNSGIKTPYTEGVQATYVSIENMCKDKIRGLLNYTPNINSRLNPDDDRDDR